MCRIGARLDEDPLLFFSMCHTDTEELVTQAVKDKTGELLARADTKSSRVIADVDLSGLFGIDLDVKPDFSAVSKSFAAIRPSWKKKSQLIPAAEPASEENILRTAASLVLGNC